MSLDDTFGWSAIALCLVGMALLFIGGATRPRGERIRCPGPSHSVLTWFDPRRLIIRGRCWYDLTGLPLDDAAHVRCPECGTRVHENRMVLDGRRVRWEVVGSLAMLLSFASFLPPWLHSGSWTRSIPTLALAVVNRAGGVETPGEIRDEVDRRITGGEFTGLSASIIAESLVQELCDDDVHWNAERAEYALSQMGSAATAALNDALIHGDAQQRLLAARILRVQVNEPSPALLAACVEDLRNDADEVSWYLSLGNASAAADYLVMWARSARPHLANGLRSSDRQQRLLCAAVIGQAGLTESIDDAAPILIEHLRDNNIRGDAKVAAPALFGFGPPVIPFLQPHIDSSDKQFRGILRSLIERIENPNRSIHHLKNPLPRVSETDNDPLTNLSAGESASDLRWRD